MGGEKYTQSSVCFSGKKEKKKKTEVIVSDDAQ
jgi:hypothetical protein